MTRVFLCQPHASTRLIRNVAARGLSRTFVLRIGQAVGGSVVVRSGPLPFFVLASRRVHPLTDGLTVRRGFFDASFEVVVLAEAAVNVRLD